MSTLQTTATTVQQQSQEQSQEQSQTSARADRILWETRWGALMIVPFLVAASILLYLWPDNTTELFAWTIKPSMTPLMLGAAYGAGVYFFMHAFLGKQWHRVSIGFIPIATFAWIIIISTILHWDRFNHAHYTFWLWVGVYSVTPILVLVLWFRNRSQDPGTPESNDVVVPVPVRWIAGVAGASMVATGLFLFLIPETALKIWPWTLTPLTARVVGAMFAFPGLMGVLVAREPRWSVWRIVIENQIIGLALILLGALRAWSDFDQSNPLTWVFVAGMSGLLICALALEIAMQSRRSTQSQARPRVSQTIKIN